MNENDRKKREVKLEWKDYVAITIAALQTTLLPILLLLVVILAFALIFSIFLAP